MDTMKSLGELALASRLKRLSDRLTRDVSLLYRKLDYDFEARWFTIISALYNKSPMTITELAVNLGVSHTAVNQLAKELIKKGYITSLKGRKDERQHLLSLSTEGKNICIKLIPIWKKIKDVNRNLITSIDPCLLTSIEKIEGELDRLSMHDRIWLEMFGSMPGKLSIICYNSRLKKHFKKLNYEWLEEYFTIEDTDKKILLHPKEKIINKGGTIFFALLDDEIVGTCAVIKHSDDKYELAKMSVTKRKQNRGIGKELLKSAINWVIEKQAQVLYILTNEKLISANILYKKNGFERIEKNPFDDINYQRETFAMKLNLSKIII